MDFLFVLPESSNNFFLEFLSTLAPKYIYGLEKIELISFNVDICVYLFSFV
jgi:hypothetical protein